MTEEVTAGYRSRDWKAIKTEYITTNTSYRKLAEKYGVNVTNIAKRARAEGWVGERKQYANKTQSKMIEKISKRRADRAAKVQTVAALVIDCS